MSLIVAITNQKGGVGKTASAVNLAYFSALGGRRTLVWDLDPQGAAFVGSFVDELYRSTPLAPRDRERCLIVMLAERHQTLTLGIHIYWGLMEGLHLPEICQTLLLAGGYSGIDTYSMGLRLSETLALEVGDVDRARGQVHIRRGKGHKDRFVPLPDLTYRALRALWAKHRHPRLLFPNPVGAPERIRAATTHMDRGGVQQAVKALVTECGIKKRSHRTIFDTPMPLI